MNVIGRVVSRGGVSACQVILLLSLSALSVPAQTNRWSFVTNDRENEIEWYLDLETIQQSGDNYRFWDKQVFKDGSYIKERMIIYCRQRKMQRLQAAIYDRNDYFDREIRGTPIIDIVPESVSERFYKLFCMKQQSAPSVSTNSVRKGKISKKGKSKMVEVITRMANVRGDPAMDSEILETVERGTKFQLAKTKPVGGWYEVQFTRTTTAWIHGSTIEFIDE